MKRVLLLVALLLAFACAFAAQGDEGEIGGVGGGPKITVEPFPSPLDSDDGDDEADDDETAFLQEDGDDSSDDADADSTADSSDADDNNEEIVAEKDEDKPAEEAESKQEDAAAAPAAEAEQKQEDAAAPAADAAVPAVDSDAEPADDMAANGVTRAELADVDELNDEEHEGAAIPNADAPTLLKADGTEMSSFLMTEEEFREPPLPKHSYMDSTDNNAFNMPGLDPSQPSDESALIDLAVPRNAEEAEENDAYRYLSPDEKQVIEEELHDAHFNIIPKLLHERSLQQAKLDAQF